jgi:hypothetical protein
LYDGSYKLGVVRISSQFSIFNVCGINYLWLDYLVLVVLGLWTRLLKYEHRPINNVLLGNYFQGNWRFELYKSQKKNNFAAFHLILGYSEDILSAVTS